MKIFFSARLAAVCIILILPLISIPSLASTKEKKLSKQRALAGFLVKNKIDQVRSNSPYKQYDIKYRKLYQTGQMSEKEFTDKMMELKTLELARQQGITNKINAYATERRRQSERQMDSLSRASEIAQLTQPQIIGGNRRQRVTDQYGNTVAYVEEN